MMAVSRSCLSSIILLAIVASQMVATSSNDIENYFEPEEIGAVGNSSNSSTAYVVTSSATEKPSVTFKMISSSVPSTAPTVPAKTSPTPVKRPNTPVKRPTTPTKRPTTPVKRPTTPTKRPTTPVKRPTKLTSPKSEASTVAKPRSKYLQLIFSGSATNWTDAAVQICLICKSNRTSKLRKQFACYNVTEVVAITNHSTRNDYKWHINRVDSASCTKLVFYWGGKWLTNGKQSSNWTREKNENQQPFNHTADLIRCDGRAVEISTIWGVENVTDIICASAFHNFTTVSPADFTGNANNSDAITGIPPFSISRDTTDGSSKPVSPFNATDPGAIIAIVVCSLAILVVVFLVTMWGIRCVNKSRRRRRLDLNFDDYDGTSISFDSVGRNMRFKAKSESKTNLYTSLPDDHGDEDSEQEVYSQTFTFTGEMEDVHHRSGGGVASVYENKEMSTIPSRNKDGYRRTSADHHPLTFE